MTSTDNHSPICTNGTSMDTSSYLNISTSSETGLVPSKSTRLTATTLRSKSTANGISTSTRTTANEAMPGYSSGVTMAVGSNSSKTVDFTGFYIPASMVAGMAACFALALLL